MRAVDTVRNGNRWRVVGIDFDHERTAARRLEDGAAAVFSGDYLREHVTHGYAVTVHKPVTLGGTSFHARE